jgi:hypothetical protein
MRTIKHVLSAQESETIIQSLHKLVNVYPQIIHQRKTKLFCYYKKKKKSKKLVFYINPRVHEIIFGIGHRGTDILETYPILRSIADETKTSVIKFSIKKREDIEDKAISKIIELILIR